MIHGVAVDGTGQKDKEAENDCARDQDQRDQAKDSACVMLDCTRVAAMGGGLTCCHTGVVVFSQKGRRGVMMCRFLDCLSNDGKLDDNILMNTRC